VKKGFVSYVGQMVYTSHQHIQALRAASPAGAVGDRGRHSLVPVGGGLIGPSDS
jgi:hypothetical protein